MGLPVCRVCGIIVYVRGQILYFRLIFPQLNRWYVDFLLQNDILIAKERWIDMDQIKIGRFISERRRASGLTQAELAEKLGITDRAVSKWETGRSLPDAANMLDLCGLLKITVTDLLCGEVVSMENYNNELEKQLIELKKQKEEADRNLLRMEIVIGVISVVVLLAGAVVASYVPNIPEWQRVLVVVAGMIPILVAFPFLLKIEQKAGYYECKKCGHRYIPTIKAVTMAPHAGRTRKMRCPNCNEKTWQKKVISLDKE